MTGAGPKPEWLASIAKGAEWIHRKRIKQHREPCVVGLLPAGFSAEHLGPNDYYYWDDFWGVAGLQAASHLLEGSGHAAAADKAKNGAADFLAAIDASLKSALRSKDLNGALPASPLRRMDSGAIGSIAVSYPLNLWPGDDARVKATLEFLLGKCMIKGTFFQDMIHSGMNAYLTLHMAQCLLRLEDPRFFQLVVDTAAVASPTGQWPEAIHPHTLGGCMGDGQHVWAAAEWALMMRNMFMREEDNALVIGSGIPESWLQSGKPMSFGPGPTRFGAVTIHIRPSSAGVLVSWKGEWRKRPDSVVVKIPGRKPVTFTGVGDGEVVL
jgi:hypothetical protein